MTDEMENWETLLGEALKRHGEPFEQTEDKGEEK
jgi:hypothetical protein